MEGQGVPWQSVDALYQQELQTTADRIREMSAPPVTRARGSQNTSNGCRCWLDYTVVQDGSWSLTLIMKNPWPVQYNRVLLLPAATQGLVDLDQSNEFVRLGLRQS